MMSTLTRIVTFSRQLFRQKRQRFKIVESVMFFSPWFFRVYICLAKVFPKLFPEDLSEAIITGLGYSTLKHSIKHRLLTKFPANTQLLKASVIDAVTSNIDYHDSELMRKTYQWLSEQIAAEDSSGAGAKAEGKTETKESYVSVLSKQALEELAKHII